MAKVSRQEALLEVEDARVAEEEAQAEFDGVWDHSEFRDLIEDLYLLDPDPEPRTFHSDGEPYTDFGDWDEDP